MHGFAILAQCELSEPFGISYDLGSFGPGVTVAMKCDSLDFEPSAALPKFIRPIFGSHGSKIREQRPELGKVG
jgi:hypothetical protein